MAASQADPPARELTRVADAILELDLLLRALLTSLPTLKPWQRQLRRHLADADRCMQVLRMTISMERAEAEIRQSAHELVAALRAANSYVAAGRADTGTKHAVHLGFELGQRVLTGVVTVEVRSIG